MPERMIPATKYETLLVAEAIRLATPFYKGATFTERGNRWGSPLFIYSLDTVMVSISAKQGDRDVSVSVGFDLSFKTATVEWFGPTFDRVEKKVKVSPTFLNPFVEALRQEWQGRDPFAVVAAQAKKSWYKTGSGNWTKAQERDAGIHSQAQDAISLLVAVATDKGAPIKFEHKGKTITGSFQGLKPWRRKAPPGGDPSSGNHAIVHAQGLAYSLSTIHLKGFGKAA